MKTDSHIWLNGALAPAGAVFTAADRVRLGQGVFDTLLVDEGRPVQGAAHFERLLRHARVLGIACPYGPADLTGAAQSLITACGAGRGRYALNTVLTMGPAARGLAPPEAPTPQMVMQLSPLAAAPTALSLITATVTRRNEHSPLSRIKSCNYGDNLLAMAQAWQAGAAEAVMLSTTGAIAGACAGTFYALMDGRLLTPPLSDGAMESLTRAALLQSGVAFEASLMPQDLSRAQALYVGNSLRGLVPVSSLDDRIFDPGPAPIDPDFYLR